MPELSAFSLEGRRVLVTGASRGIGAGLAVGMAAAGADLVLAGRPGTLEETEAAVKATGAATTTVHLDLADPTALALDDLPEVDVLVNNAGIIHRDPAADVALSDWQRVLDVNLSSLFALTQHLARPMLARGRGKVINVASLLSFQGGVNVSSYAASKHAVAGLTRALANEWAAEGLCVNAIAPGYIETDNTAPLRADADRHRAISERIPAGRWGTPADLVGAAVFLASGASDYVNGHVLVVDGGWTAR